MTCCDSWGHCTRGPGCAAGSAPLPTLVAPVKAHYRRVTDLDGYMSRPAPLELPVADNAQDLEQELNALVNRASAPGQRGNIWYAGDEPAQQPAKREPLTRVELLALLVLIVTSLASVAVVFAGLWWLLSLEGLFA